MTINMKKFLFLAVLLAFTFRANAYHWTVNPNQYPNTMTAIAIIQIDGVEQMVNTLEVGAFCGDECRGREMPVYIEQMGRYYLFLTMYGTEGDQLTFRLYDHVLNQEFDGTCSNVESFVTNGTLGSPVSPYIFEFVSAPVNYTITATADPVEGGTITGAGTYQSGSTCTLTATPNTGYEFTNWTENGTEVSTNASYTFTVTCNRNLVANFTSVSGGYHWTVNPNQYPNTMTAIAVIQIDGVEQMVNTLEVGAFCGDECRGREIPVYIEQMDRYYLFLTMYGVEGDQLTFRLYDHVLDQEFDGTCSNVESFVTNGTLGSPISPYIFEFVSATVNYTITATADPTAGGSVSGGGTYQSGSTCTLTATPNTGYNFINWTKNGTVVSTNPTYSFTVTEDVDLVANFEADLPGDPNGDGMVNALDIVIIVNFIFGETPEEFIFDNADVNGDGVVNALDVVVIINLIFSKES